MSTSPFALPDRLEIEPLARPPVAQVRVPGSKSITNRALVLAALTGPTPWAKAPDAPEAFTLLRDVLRSEDTELMVRCLQGLGLDVRTIWSRRDIVVVARPISEFAPQAELFVGNSGTTMRFLTAMLSLGHGRYRLDGVPRMRERPIADLLDALTQLGVRVRSELGNGCPPVTIEANGLRGGRVRIRGDVSSQFLSGLMMAAPLAEGDITLEVEGTLVSQPYVTLTAEIMNQFGARVETEEPGRYLIPGRQSYRPRTFHVEPDASAASYFAGAAAVSGGEVRLMGLTRDSLQGDIRFLNVLEEMGCRIESAPDSINVHGGPLRGVDVDMNDISDTVMTLAAVACFAEGTTTIRNVAHIRHKETDRLAALAVELRRLGAGVEELSDGLRISPGRLHAGEVETYDDHRMAMSLSLVGLRVPGIVIRNPGCVGKTYPGFFADLEKLRC